MRPVNSFSSHQVFACIAAFGLSMCKFKHRTVEGFRPDGSLYGVLGNEWNEEESTTAPS
jgi:hypothetical protein